MADIVQIVQRIPGADLSLQPGSPRSVAQNVVTRGQLAITGSGVRGLVSDTIQRALGSSSNRSYSGIFENFLSRVLQTYSNAPVIMPLWVCYFDSFPSAGTVVEDLDVHGAGKHSIEKQHEGAKRSSSPMRFGGGLAMLFCQGVDTPSDDISVTRDTSLPTGGYIQGFLGSNRNLNEVTLSFIDTNNSFTDFVLRPWLIYNSYQGIPYGDRRNIVIEQYTKNGAGDDLRLRKKFTLVNAFPTKIDNERLTYSDLGDYRQIQFQYESYKLEGSNTFELGARLIDKVIETGANIAQGLVTGAIDSFVSNVYSSLSPSFEVQSGSNQIETKLPSRQDTPDKTQITKSSFSQLKTAPASQINNITTQVNSKTDLKSPKNFLPSDSSSLAIKKPRPEIDNIQNSSLLEFDNIIVNDQDTATQFPSNVPSQLVRRNNILSANADVIGEEETRNILQGVTSQLNRVPSQDNIDNVLDTQFIASEAIKPSLEDIVQFAGNIPSQPINNISTSDQITDANINVISQQKTINPQDTSFIIDNQQIKISQQDAVAREQSVNNQTVRINSSSIENSANITSNIKKTIIDDNITNNIDIQVKFKKPEQEDFITNSVSNNFIKINDKDNPEINDVSFDTKIISTTPSSISVESQNIVVPRQPVLNQDIDNSGASALEKIQPLIESGISSLSSSGSKPKLPPTEDSPSFVQVGRSKPERKVNSNDVPTIRQIPVVFKKISKQDTPSL
jgi:hypothetical protein